MAISAQDLLDALVPTRKELVMDAVASAGVDVSLWGVKQNGMPAKSARANPMFCYEWSFGGHGQPAVVCIWHASLKVEGGRIVYRGNLVDHAQRLEAIRFDRKKPQSNRSRAIDQAARARRVDALCKATFLAHEPLRVILLKGDQRKISEAGVSTASVRYRTLDPEPWYVHSYSPSGDLLIVRGHKPSSAVRFVDQFSAPPQPERRTSETSSFIRSPEVRRTALERANGKCQYCGAKGFRMDDGSIYLETHHVVSLSEGGPDVEWNVVALCPNDHSEAHFGVRRHEIRADLVSMLSRLYPSAATMLGAIAKRTRVESSATVT